MTEKRRYDSTVARIAGNIAGHMIDRMLVSRIDDVVGYTQSSIDFVAFQSVLLARAIVAEVERTEPR